MQRNLAIIFLSIFTCLIINIVVFCCFFWCYSCFIMTIIKKIIIMILCIIILLIILVCPWRKASPEAWLVDIDSRAHQPMEEVSTERPSSVIQWSSSGLQGGQRWDAYQTSSNCSPKAPSFTCPPPPHLLGLRSQLSSRPCDFFQPALPLALQDSGHPI